MPANNVDLRAVLPFLDDALKPFADAIAQADNIPASARPSGATMLRAFAPVAILPLGALRNLVEAARAVQRMAGENV